jgi:ribonuclease P protein component
MFDRVFQGPEKRVHRPSCLVLVKQNGKAHGRLGLVVGKKNISRAVQRNTFKRICREVFRKSQLCSVDVLVLAKRHVNGIDRKQLASDLQLVLAQIENQA